MASLIKQNGWFYLQFYSSKRKPNRKRIPLKTRTKRKAKKLRRKLEDAYAEREYDPWIDEWREDKKGDSIRTLSEALELYISVKTKEDWRETTATNNGYILRNFCRFCGQDLPVYGLKGEKVNRYINRDKYAYETKKTHKKRIMAFLRWLYKEGYTRNDFGDVKIYNQNHEQDEGINYLSPEEIQKLIQTIRQKVAQDIEDGYQHQERNALWLIDLINWQRYSGMRISETLNLRCKDINTTTWEVRIGSDSFSTKSKAKQVLPIGQVEPLKRIAEKWMGRAESDTDRLFQHKDRRRTTRTFKKYLRRALPDREEITLHSLRHTCCIELLRAGVPIYTVQRWMRHASLKTTQRYADLLRTDIGKAVGEGFKEVY